MQRLAEFNGEYAMVAKRFVELSIQRIELTKRSQLSSTCALFTNSVGPGDLRVLFGYDHGNQKCARDFHRERTPKSLAIEL